MRQYAENRVRNTYDEVKADVFACINFRASLADLCVFLVFVLIVVF